MERWNCPLTDKGVCTGEFEVAVDYTATFGQLLSLASVARVDRELSAIESRNGRCAVDNLLVQTRLFPRATSLRGIESAIMDCGCRGMRIEEMLSLAVKVPNLCVQRALACPVSPWKRFGIIRWLPLLDVGTAGRMLLLRRFHGEWCSKGVVEFGCVRTSQGRES
jgi:hypothetical protein